MYENLRKEEGESRQNEGRSKTNDLLERLKIEVTSHTHTQKKHYDSDDQQQYDNWTLHIRGDDIIMIILPDVVLQHIAGFGSYHDGLTLSLSCRTVYHAMMLSKPGNNAATRQSGQWRRNEQRLLKHMDHTMRDVLPGEWIHAFNGPLQLLRCPLLTFRLEKEQSDTNLSFNEAKVLAPLLLREMYQRNRAIVRLHVIMPHATQGAALWYARAKHGETLTQWLKNTEAQKQHVSSRGIAIFIRRGYFQWKLHIVTDRWETCLRNNGQEINSSGMWWWGLPKRLQFAERLRCAAAGITEKDGWYSTCPRWWML